MCGRCVIARDPSTLRRCCAEVSYPYRSAPSKAEAACEGTTDPSCDLPSWYQGCESRYRPSYNVCPKDNLPVLLSSDQPHTCEEAGAGGRVLQMMQWGLVPSWHKGPAAQFSYLLNNCRSESLLDKASFRNAFERGYRCVIPIDGFYEWKTMDKKKHPYYIHSQEKGRMLMVAGVFDVHREGGDAPPLYTVTLITTHTLPEFSEIHSRMPALLEGEDQVSDWLDFKRVSGQGAYSLVMPTSRLTWYPVGPSVNNVYYKGEECLNAKPMESPQKGKPKGVTLDNFFKRTPVKRKSDESHSVKRIKGGDREDN